MAGIKELLAMAHIALAQEGIEHALIGGLALGGRGVHRATLDVDFLVDGARGSDAQRALEQAGFDLQNETREVMHFGGIGSVDLLLANRPLSREMLQRAAMLPALGIKCVTVEDLIGLKIQAYWERIMTFDEYLEFLDDYWALFGPIPPSSTDLDLFSNIKL